MFPTLLRNGPRKGMMLWKPLEHARVLRVLRNPRFAGAFAFGRQRQERLPDGRVKLREVERDDWEVLLRDMHPGYITWERYEANQERLRENARAYGLDRTGPPREGPALLQGLVTCGVCGRRMTIAYRKRTDGLQPVYSCQREAVECADKQPCQRVFGAAVDRAVGALVAASVTPASLEVALQVQAELEQRASEADALREREVKRLRDEAERAKWFLLRAHPEHTEAVEELEAHWTGKLRELRAAQDRLERFRASGKAALGEAERARIRALASDFPRLWNDPATPHRERKRMVCLLLKDVTLTQGDAIAIGIRWRGGAVETLAVPRERNAAELRRTDPEVIAEIDRLLDQCTDAGIAEALNGSGRVSGTGQPFSADIVSRLRRRYGLRSRFDRLREAGLVTQTELAERFGVCPSTVLDWCRAGLLRGHVFNDKGEHLYEDPGELRPTKQPGSQAAKGTCDPYNQEQFDA